ncbi:tetratricopeptide repeat protein [Clostridium felsineum]|uniref:Uncharacterized protein n=1 Tax=Clostridium felsineum TaxID=36839 RepID=A0A1S8L524_9CLOT|nr:tetratricopeptide repeat protein [Clostridium felsineum]URZ06801.1 hypothetical protein CLROS_021340 [Clostridium felsineum]URZ11833.1 hypothetical protein CROST_025500 [Clostridium felsineum]
MDDVDYFTNATINIKMLEKDKEYKECIERTKLLLQEIKLTQYSNKKPDEWFCYIELARCYKNINQYDKALKYIKQAEQNYWDDYGFDYMGITCKASIYEAMGNIDDAILLYRQCLEYIKTIPNMERVEASTMFNIGYLSRNPFIMNRAINIYKTYCKNTWNYKKTLNDMEDYLKEILASKN